MNLLLQYVDPKRAPLEPSAQHAVGLKLPFSRGFTQLKESDELIEAVRRKVTQIAQAGTSTTEQPRSAIESHLKNTIRDEVGTFLFQKTERRPMVLPVVIEV